VKEIVFTRRFERDFRRLKRELPRSVLDYETLDYRVLRHRIVLHRTGTHRDLFRSRKRR